VEAIVASILLPNLRKDFGSRVEEDAKQKLLITTYSSNTQLKLVYKSTSFSVAIIF
jgi:hypothetical protein